MMDSVLIFLANTDPANETQSVAVKGNVRKEIILNLYVTRANALMMLYL